MAIEEATVVNEEVAQPTAPESTTEVKETETAPVETESTDTGEFSEADVKEESTEAKAEGAEEPEQKSGAEKRKEQLQGEIQDLKQEAGIDPNTEIRDLVAARNALKQSVRAKNNQAYRPATEQELSDQVNPETGEYYSPIEAKVLAMEQRQQLEQYNEQVAETQLVIQSEAQRAIRDFPMFDAQSPDYRPDLAAQADQLLSQSIVVDPNTGQIIGSHVSPYQLYKSFNDTYHASAVQHQIQGQKATEAMLATADVVGGAPQKETPFEKLSTSEMRERLRAKGHDV